MDYDFDVKGLAARAVKAREQAYAPYSNFLVGAALLGADGTLYTGGNIENAAYSVCNCAERTALFKAVSEGRQHFAALAVAGGARSLAPGQPLPLCTPCGVCRQALYEFCDERLPVLLVYGAGEHEAATLGELLPRGFGPKDVGKRQE